MNRVRRWRFLAAQRSGRVRWALTYVVMGLLVTALAAIATAGQSQIREAARAFLVELAPVGLAPVPALVGGTLVIAGLLIYLTPLPRTHSYLATNPRRIPRVAVYLDAENQLPNAAIQSFLAQVRSFVGGRRADLVFFTDAAHTADGARYRALVKGGFRPVDVPHKRVEGVDGDTDNTKNAVDIELSLYAYQKALLSPQPMDIVLVTGDQDFLPLIRRLWAEGHSVHVWAMRIPLALSELAQQLGIEAKPYSAMFTWEKTESPTHSANRSKRQRAQGPRVVPGSLGSAALSNPPVQAARAENPTYLDRERLTDVFTLSVRLLEQTRAKFGVDRRAILTLGSLTGDKIKPVAEALGFTGLRWTTRWMLFLTALGVYADAGAGVLPDHGPTSPEQAADLLLRFLDELGASARSLAASTPDGVVTFAALRGQLVQTASEDPQTAGLRRLLAITNPAWPSPMIQFIGCASATGALVFERIPGRSAIRLARSA